MKTLKTYQNRNHTAEAQKMTRLEYSKFCGREVHEDENPDDEGYMVAIPTNASEWNVSGAAGYMLWLPEKVFAQIYQIETAS